MQDFKQQDSLFIFRNIDGDMATYTAWELDTPGNRHFVTKAVRLNGYACNMGRVGTRIARFPECGSAPHTVGECLANQQDTEDEMVQAYQAIVIAYPEALCGEHRNGLVVLPAEMANK